ncbi:hypothetical protein [Nonomuraea sp. NPDC050786]|uniref:hypothetical protein n=1 Tax=Nonomuraea sp. NPDC050786 TaxID=3154840 RepID=UPI0033D4B940
MESRQKANDALVADAVQRAGQMFDMLTAGEQRSLFLNIYEDIAKYSRTGDIDHLKKLAESVEVTVRLRSTPEIQQALRDAPTTPIGRGEGVDVDDVVKTLRE